MSSLQVKRSPTHLFVYCLALFLCFSGGQVNAQATEVPIDVQVSLMLKALTYSKNLPDKLQDGKLIVGICYQENYRRSYLQMEALSEAFSNAESSWPIQVVKIPLGENGRPVKVSDMTELSCIYITGLRALNPDALLSQTRSLHIISLSTEPEAAQRLVTMSFQLIGSRPKFGIHLAHASEERCEFSSQLLKLALVY
jgi:hypothetical protein